MQVVAQSITPPRLVINIVVGSMGADDINKYHTNLTASGFVKMTSSGTNFTQAYYPSSQTVTATSLATLTTGALPSTHGIVGGGWWDYLTGDRVDVVVDTECGGIPEYNDKYSYSPRQLIASTIGDGLLAQSPKSQSLAIAVEPLSAVIMGGERGVCFWVDDQSCEWSTSSYYAKSQESWVDSFNKSAYRQKRLDVQWSSLFTYDHYKNSHTTHLTRRGSASRYESPSPKRTRSIQEQQQARYEQISLSPVGNKEVLLFAQEVIKGRELGADEHPDILNIYLDPARNITQKYGASSVEREDMYYRLDADIADFILFVETRFEMNDVLFTLTSDHGTSPSYGELSQTKGLFNIAQFEVVVGSFLRARYGDKQWVLGYESRNLYLNREAMYEAKLDIAAVQREVATFALQFKGVSHALTATELRGGYFASDYGGFMQRSFYPSRSGDVVINLMPGWIEEQMEPLYSDSGSAYRYDRHVPLAFYSEGMVEIKQVDRKVGVETLAATLAKILAIEPPVASESDYVEEIFE